MPLSPTDALQARLRAAADLKAFEAVTRHSDLRGDPALRVARHAVTAAAPDLRAMYAQKMGGTSAKEATAAGAVITVALAIELATYITVFRNGGPKTKTLAASALACSIALFTYGRVKARRIRQASIADLGRLKTSAGANA